MNAARHALVIANDEYADSGLSQLAAPALDAEALADVLGDPAVGGFDVEVVHNEPAQEIRVAIEEFFADRRPEDLLLLHFSCHGLKSSAGELFLAVRDTRPSRLASTAIAADFVSGQMADSRAQRIALFLDCCYGGAFPRGMVVRAGGEAQVRDAFAGQDAVGGGRGRVIVTASSSMEYAFEGEQLASAARTRPSVFTSAVVDGLTTGEADADGDGWVGMTELFGYVTDRVRRSTPHQTPQMWTFGAQGDLMIARSRIRRITPAPLPPELLEAMTSPLAATRYGVACDLRDRLLGDDLGQAYAAWLALRELTGDDSRKVSEVASASIADAVPVVTPAELDLDPTEPVASVVLSGPPVALTAVARSSAAWVTVEQEGTAVRITATAPESGNEQATVVLKAPTGDVAIPVRLRTLGPPDRSVSPAVSPAAAGSPAGSSPPATSPPAVPSPDTSSAVAVSPVASSPPGTSPPAVSSAAAAGDTAAGTDPSAATGLAAAGVAATPAGGGAQDLSAGWKSWLIAILLTLCGLVLVMANLPSSENEWLWYAYGSNVDRAWTDGFVLASFGVILGALASLAITKLRQPGTAGGRAGWAAYSLGVTAGLGLYFAIWGLVTVGQGWLESTDDGRWPVTLVLGLAVAGLAVWWLRVLARSGPRWQRLDAVTTGAVLAGLAVMLVLDFAGVPEVGRGAILLDPVGAMALAVLPALLGGRGAWPTAAAVAAVTHIVMSIVLSLHVTEQLSAPGDQVVRFLAAYAVALAVLVIGLLRARRQVAST
jgi:uncharacterized caspase-like protein